MEKEKIIEYLFLYFLKTDIIFLNSKNGFHYGKKRRTIINSRS
jgi:hypothetical protein